MILLVRQWAIPNILVLVDIATNLTISKKFVTIGIKGLSPFLLAVRQTE